jgi:putative membrane-bound dehydrogenase-like protein
MKGFLVTLSLILGTKLAFAAGRQLTGPYTPAAGPPLLPLEAQKKFVVPEGFEVRLFAAEPDVINPVAMTWDERGRLWVLELYEYPLGAPPGTKPRDRIKILEDTDNDGVADKVTVFADGLNLATGLALGNGGVYVGQAPDFLFLQDTNHDDKADTKTVLLTGFGLDDRHELLNGFTWGPDGWLYMTHGVFTHSRVKIPEASAPGIEVTAAVARYQPQTKKFEVFADGTSNPWGVDFDRYGNAFVSACVIDHLFHMAPGGIYVRQGGVPANPYAYELLPSIVDHKHHMAAYCGICIYQGDQFPEEYRGHVFVGNIHQNAINHDRLIPNGSSFKAVAEKDFLTTSDGWFRPISEQVGPDGALWVGDWYDKYPCYQNAQADPEGVDRERGRIWRVVHTGKNPGKKMPGRPETKMDLAKASPEDLVKLLEHPNVWQRRMAQRLLAPRILKKETTFQESLSRLRKDGKTLESRLAAQWLFHDVEFPSPNDKQNSSKTAAERAWSARFAAEPLRKFATMDQNLYEETIAKLLRGLEESARDPDPSVKLAVATAVRELVSNSLTVDTETKCNYQIGGILAALIKSSADAKDPLLPFMIWMAGEPTFAKNPEGGLKWLADNGADTMPLSGILTRKAMRRICDMQDDAKLDLAVEFLLQIAGKDGGFILAAIDGLIEGQKAKPLVPKAETKELFAKLTANPDPKVQLRARELGTLWGNAALIQATIAAVNDASLSTNERAKAIEAVKALKNAASSDALLRLINGNNAESLIIDAIRALGQIGGDRVADDLLGSWNKFSPQIRFAVADVLVSRHRWAIALLSALESKTISRQELPLTAIRVLGESKDEFIRQRAIQVIGRIRPADADKQKIIEQKKQMILSGGTPDLQAGHEVAKKTCFVCHKLYGEGADVGPDLTGVGRSSLDALLANVIDPNQIVGKGYENVQIETKDGRSLSGRLVEESDSSIKLLSSGPKEDVIAKSDITSRRVSELSVMPEGLEQMPDADFRNLISYILHPPQEAKR